MENENDQEKDLAFEKLWSSYAQRRAQAIVWKVLQKIILTKKSLQNKCILQPYDDTSCTLSGDDEENIGHLFFNCSFTSRILNFYVWTKLLMVQNYDPIGSFLQHDNFFNLDSNASKSTTMWVCIIRII